MIERSVWGELGGFDPDFFMYGEEADLCLRARRLGANPMVTPAATIVHHGGASERLRGEKIAKVMLAKRKLLDRHWASWLVWYGVLMLHARVWVRLIGYRFGSKLSGSGAHREQADQWATVWRLRRAWNDPTRLAISDGSDAGPDASGGARGSWREERRLG